MKYGMLKEWGSPIRSQPLSSYPVCSAPRQSPRIYFHSRFRLMTSRGE
ncbi:hypothetical protein [Bacteroides caecigallinarum]|nr:hypothetical protein [Bacteroides caecigallinarum]